VLPDLANIPQNIWSPWNNCYRYDKTNLWHHGTLRYD